MKRAYKLRAYPTRPQEGRAVRLPADHCDLYNAALQERREARREGERATDRLPRFKPYQRVQPGTVRRRGWRQMGGRQRWPVGACDLQGGWTGQGETASAYRGSGEDASGEAGGPPLVCGCRHRYRHRPLPSTDRSVGLDIGVARFLTTSDGEIVPNPRFLDAAQERIAERQRRKERARPGSGNRRRLRRALAKEWRKLRNQRRGFHHKTARGLVDTCATLALEDLHVTGMTASAARTVEHPGRNVAAKAGLNRSIPDAGWSQFTRRAGLWSSLRGLRSCRLQPAERSP